MEFPLFSCISAHHALASHPSLKPVPLGAASLMKTTLGGQTYSLIKIIMTTRALTLFQAVG